MNLTHLFESAPALTEAVEWEPQPCPYCSGTVHQEGRWRLRCEYCRSRIARSDLPVRWYAGMVPPGVVLAVGLLAFFLLLPLVRVQQLRQELHERLYRGLLIKK